jgi:hypothetical protein
MENRLEITHFYAPLCETDRPHDVSFRDSIAPPGAAVQTIIGSFTGKPGRGGVFGGPTDDSASRAHYAQVRGVGIDC